MGERQCKGECAVYVYSTGIEGNFTSDEMKSSPAVLTFLSTSPRNHFGFVAREGVRRENLVGSTGRVGKMECGDTWWAYLRMDGLETG